MPGWTSRTFTPLPEEWPDSEHWIAEWLVLDDETWYSRISLTGDPGMPPIVMIHGLVVSGAYFRPVAMELDDRYRIFVPDLPGYGRSLSRSHWSLPQLASRLARWLDAHELRQVVLVANSLGCQIATLLATQRPDLVRGMVLIAPTLDPSVHHAIQLLWRGALDVPREKQTLWRIWIPDLFRAGPRRSLSMLHQLMIDGPHQLARLANVQQPTLVVGGEDDPIIPAGWVAEMAHRLPHARDIILPNCAHAMNYSNPVGLARAIDRVIREKVEEDEER